MFTIISVLYQSWYIGNSGLSLLGQLAYIIILFAALRILESFCREDKTLCRR